MIKRSRQREAIRQCLTGRYDHPTAETVYMSIKDEFPNISLGTVPGKACPDPSHIHTLCKKSGNAVPGFRQICPGLH